MDIIFENVWLLLTVAGIALVIASVVRQVKPEWGWWPMLAPVVIAGLAVAADAAVLTDAEAVGQIIADGKKAVVENDVEALMTLVSPNYRDSARRTREKLESDIRSYLRYGIEKIKTQNHVLTITDRTAQSDLNLVVHFDTRSRDEMIGSLVFVGMTVHFEKIGQRWFVSSVDNLTVNNDPF